MLCYNSEPMDPFYYRPGKLEVTAEMIDSSRNWSRFSVSFPVARPTVYAEQNTVYGEYYRARARGNHPLAVLVHGLGDSSTIPCRIIARDLAKKGISSFVIYLVFHSRRMPAAIRKKMPYLSAEEWFQGYQTSVIDIRQVLDWAERLSEIDNRQISITGISLGGIIASISMGIDRRIKKGTFIVAGGNYESPTWLMRGRNRLSRQECDKAVALYRQYLEDVKTDGLDRVEPAKKSYLTDPVTYSHLLRERPVQMLNALCDERIPRQSSIDFWESLGQPPIFWYPATHALIWMFYPSIRSRIVDLLCK